ncbi:MAG: mechanosensitive ion channel [Victivallaceae bacterium]|nr:mechanosensitive ion channel [Victivallaceae bacterium]
MHRKSLLKNLLFIVIFAALNGGAWAGDAKDDKNTDAQKQNIISDVKTAAKDAKGAVEDAKVAAKDAKGAIEDARDAAKDAENAAKQAQKAVEKAKVVNLSLFTINNVDSGRDENKPENVSIVKPADFKVESLADLIVRIEDWWRGVRRWMGNQQLNLLVLFAGVMITFLLVTCLGWLFGRIILWRIRKKGKGEWAEQICGSLKRPLAFLVFTVGVFLSSLRLLNQFDEEFFGTALRVFFALMAFAVAWAVYRLVGVLDHHLETLAERSDNELDELLVDLIRKTVRFVVVFIAVLFIGQTILGLRITALVAGAGIAGLAVALAAQETLANFFGSVMIMLDKPFTVGERITVEEINGTVEKIGFRSTRIRSLNGHMYSIPNSKLAHSTVENITKRPYIKYVFDLTLTYDTSAEKMERAMKILHEILDEHEAFNEEMPPRIFFTSFNDWALNINVIVWFQSTDYLQTQQWKNDINLEILRRFNAEGLDFAFPTSTNYLVGDSSRELKVTMLEEAKK